MNNQINKENINTLNSDSFSWKLVQTEMKSKLGTEVYESWIKKITFVDEFSNYLLLSVPTRFIRDWITSRYLDQILQIIRVYKKDIIRIEFKIAQQNQNKNKEVNEKNSDINETFSLILFSLILFSFKVIS